MVWLKAGVLVAGAVALVWVGLLMVGQARWQARTARLEADLAAGLRRTDPPRVTLAEMDALPPPVRRYLAKVLTPGQPRLLRVRMRHQGTFNMATDGEGWKRFASAQVVTTAPPGFVWDATIAMAPGLPVRVHDAYVAGEGVLVPAIFGLVPLMQMRGGGPIAEGELLRWLAETPWYPTALLPGQGVSWQPIDDHAAQATVTDGAVTASLIFRFGADDLVSAIHAEARGRTVGGAVVPTPWTGRWHSYVRHGGVLVPTQGEVAWVLPAGEAPYWRGTLVDWSAETAP